MIRKISNVRRSSPDYFINKNLIIIMNMDPRDLGFFLVITAPL